MCVAGARIHSSRNRWWTTDWFSPARDTESTALLRRIARMPSRVDAALGNRGHVAVVACGAALAVGEVFVAGRGVDEFGCLLDG